AAPAAADIENGHPRLQLQFATDQVQFCHLGILQVVGVPPVATGVGEAGVQHGSVEVVAQIIVAFPHLPGPGFVLQVEDSRLEDVEDQPGGDNFPVQAGAQYAVEKGVQAGCLPVPIHVALPQGEAAAGQQAPGEPGAVEMNVPGAVAVDLDIGLGQPVTQNPAGPELTAGQGVWGC